MATAAIDRRNLPRVAVAFVLLLATLAIRGPWFGDPIADSDEQLYSMIGQGMTTGAIPFVDLWDRKPVGLFALFALAHAIGGPGPLAYQLLAALFTFAGAWMVVCLAERQVDRLGACAAGLIYVLLIATYGGHSAQSEVFHVPLMLAMALLVAYRSHPQALSRAMLAMLVGGLALQVKYTVAPQCVFFGLWALSGLHARGAATGRLALWALAFAALGLLPTAAAALAYFMAGQGEAFLFANFTSFFARLPAPIGRLGGDGLAQFLLPLMALAGGGIYAAVRIQAPHESSLYRFALLWLAAALATVYLPSTVYRYYYGALVAPVALVALPLLDRRGPAGPVRLVLVAAGLAALLFLPQEYAQSRAQRAALARFVEPIASRVDAEHCLWVHDGPAALYRLSHSCLPTRYIYPDHLNNALEQNALGVSQEAEVKRILAASPGVIVTADTPVTPQNPAVTSLVAQAIARDYEPIATGVLHGRTLRAWGRKSGT